MIETPSQALLLVVSAPSGAGKTTLCNRLLAEFDQMVYSVSCTTRPPRAKEVDGKDYHFISEDVFRARAEAGEFLESAEVHGHWYGTLKETVEAALRAGRDVLMDIDIQGADQIRSHVGTADEADLVRRAYVDIFIAPPSKEALESRLHGRGQDATAVIEQRLHNADDELARWKDYDYVIVNDELDESYDALRAIVIAEHHRTR